MKSKLLILASFLLSVVSITALADVDVLTGAGATFPYPIYVKWAQAYQKDTGLKLNFQPIGSGGGIKQIEAKTVDFGASDKPLSSEELKNNGLIQFPTVVGGVVPVVNLGPDNNGQIKLSGPVLAAIFQGKIKNWNDAQIATLNPELHLPSLPITVVHRSDGSGTTFLFTNYLSKVSPDWAKQVGSDTAIAWPSGIGGKGNEGVASYVMRVKGSIGYVEYAYAKQNNLNFVQLQNKAGQNVNPSIASFSAAASNANWNSQNNFSEILTDEPGAASWPIVGGTFILMQAKPANPEKTKAVLQFFAWAYQKGKDMATGLDYVPLPDAVVQLIQTSWTQQIKDPQGKAIWP